MRTSSLHDQYGPPEGFTPDAEDPTPVWEDITPDLAGMWLKRYNTHNRNPSEETHGGYGRDMAGGAWNGRNGQTICFTVDTENEFGFRLTDGQHRLMSIAANPNPEFSVRILVLWGVPENSQKTTDMGRPRRAHEQLGLEGESNGPILSGVLRRICLYEVGGYTNGFKLKPTFAELNDALTKYPSVRGDVYWGACHKNDTNLPPTVTAYARWLLSQKDSDQAVWFMDALAKRTDLPEGHPVLVLHKRILRERNIGRYRSDEWIALIIIAWNFYRRGEKTSRLTMPDGPVDAKTGRRYAGLTNETFPQPM